MELVSPTPVTPKRAFKRTRLTGAHKRKLCELYKTGKYSVRNLIDTAEKHLGMSPSRGAVWGVIIESERWLALDGRDAKKGRGRGRKWRKLEDGLFEWFLQVRTIPATPTLEVPPHIQRRTHPRDLEQFRWDLACKCCERILH